MSVTMIVFDRDKMPHEDNFFDYLGCVDGITHALTSGEIFIAQADWETYAPFHVAAFRFNSDVIDVPELQCIFVRSENEDFDTRVSDPDPENMTPHMQDIGNALTHVLIELEGTVVSSCTWETGGNQTIAVKCDLTNLTNMFVSRKRKSIKLVK
jgi:hypothetical protein